MRSTLAWLMTGIRSAAVESLLASIWASTCWNVPMGRALPTPWRNSSNMNGEALRGSHRESNHRSLEMTIAGDWDVTIKTPIGSLAVEYSFSDTATGLSGTAMLKGDTVELQDISQSGDRLTWRQQVTKPMRLNLEFDVTILGDQMSGHSRAGRLPRSAVTGTRRV